MEPEETILNMAKGQTMDELITAAAESSHQFDLFADDTQDIVTVELDMKYTTAQWQKLLRLNATSTRKKRKAIRQLNRRWTNKVVPYQIGASFSARDRQTIQAALRDWMTYTCITFRRATSRDYNRIVFRNGGGCSSYVGMSGGAQTVSLARGCRIKGIVIHEVGHALGFHHEQTRPDRDSKVRINRQNISPGMYYNFQKYSSAVINLYSVPYDYLSVMHYGQYAFSINRRPTIRTVDPAYQHIIGNRRGLSFRDVKLACKMYQCAASCPFKRCPGEGFVGKDCHCLCPASPTKRCTQTGGGGGGGSVTTTTPRPTTGSCGDDNERCASWAEDGECGTNPAYMLVNCKRSCNVCGGGGTGGGGTGGSCVDGSTQCGPWARRGECRSNPAYMLVNCKRSCGSCSGGSRRCTDSANHCAHWRSKGYCQHFFVSYMEEHCSRTCGNCGNSQRNPDCTNDNQLCAYWASIGECTNNWPYMTLSCRDACNFC